MIHSHPNSDYLRDYAAGITREPVSLIIATHLALCSSCRQDVKAYEVIGGALLQEMAPCDPVTASLDNILVKLDAVEQELTPTENQGNYVGLRNFDLKKGDILLPKPLREYVAVNTVNELRALKWTSYRGYKELPVLTKYDGMKTRLMCISANTAMPQHTHEGTELTLVLSGGFQDHTGHYVQGDLVVADKHVDHSPAADPDGDCICLAVTDAPLKLTGPIGRFINPFIRL